MIKRLCRFNGWLPLVKDRVAHRAPYHRRGAKIFVKGCQASRKNKRFIKLEVVRTGVLLLFSVKSIIQKDDFINFSLIFCFSKWLNKQKGKIVDVIQR